MIRQSPEKDSLLMQPFAVISVINSVLHIQSDLNRMIAGNFKQRPLL